MSIMFKDFFKFITDSVVIAPAKPKVEPSVVPDVKPKPRKNPLAPMPGVKPKPKALGDEVSRFILKRNSFLGEADVIHTQKKKWIKTRKRSATA